MTLELGFTDGVIHKGKGTVTTQKELLSPLDCSSGNFSPVPYHVPCSMTCIILITGKEEDISSHASEEDDGNWITISGGSKR